MHSSVKQHPLVGYALLALFMLWMACGVSPLMCYESDNMHLIAGCYQMMSEGLHCPPAYSYFYDMQPLVTYVVVLLAKAIPMLDVEQHYCLFTAVMAIVALVGCVKLLQRLLPDTSIGMVLLALFFLPESYACAFYPNSTVPAFALFVWALYLICRGSWWGAMPLLCTAPLFRIDVVIVYPVLFPLLRWLEAKKHPSLVQQLGKCAMAAVIVVGFVAACCWALDANPIRQTLSTYSDFSNGGAYAAQTKVALLMFYTPLSLVLLPLGFSRMCKRREWALLFICFVPMLLLHFFFRRTGCAGKHWLYILPFVALISIRGWNVLRDWTHRRLWAKCITGLVLFVIVFCGIRITIPESLTRMSKSFTGTEQQEGPFVHLFGEDISPLHTQFGVGAGQFVPTADEMMIATGYAFYPFYIKQYKESHISALNEAYDYLNQHVPEGDFDLIGIDWGGKIALANRLQKQGWLFDTKERDTRVLYTLRRDEHTIHCFCPAVDVPKDDAERTRSLLLQAKGNSQNRIFIVPDSEARLLIMDEQVAKGYAIKHTSHCYEIL